MPQSDRIEREKEAAKDDPWRPLPYISKSRLKTYVTCPMKFWFKYIAGRKTDATFYTARGTEVHRTYEHFYENVAENILEAFDASYLSQYLPGRKTGHGRRGAADWADHMDPFIRNFLSFERGRRKESKMKATDASMGQQPSMNSEMAKVNWDPVAIEAEGWLDYDWNDERWNVPLMGFADLICESASLPDEIVGENRGVTILDFKTGSVPDEQYRDEGIYLEQEFYATIFEETMERGVTGVAAYYPKSDTLIGAPLSDERREYMDQKLHEMVALSFHGEKGQFPIEEQPLCAWSNNNGDGMCDFYGDCESMWGLPQFNGPTYDHAAEAKPDGFLDQDDAPEKSGDGIYDLGGL